MNRLYSVDRIAKSYINKYRQIFFKHKKKTQDRKPEQDSPGKIKVLATNIDIPQTFYNNDTSLSTNRHLFNTYQLKWNIKKVTETS